ncbi:MAG: DNA-binding transcriptional regulator Fis [Gammaproteobacteria bacterium]|nr:DNA-binding transcriptional regulator Fis [Gammaproteobacteria bacterium]|tara:strand:- start:82 stop:426 length:345 start_codon:yes stop_codon:yes gene_type:complete
MKKDDPAPGLPSDSQLAPAEPAAFSLESSHCSLREAVERAMANFFADVDDESLITELYELVLSEVEAPLLQAVLRQTDGNQSRASTMLGLNRGTLRKKLKQHGLLNFRHSGSPD